MLGMVCPSELDRRRCLTAGDVAQLRDVWEATGFRLEREQSAEETVEAERRGLAAREAPRWALPYTPTWTPDDVLSAADKPRVAILRWISLLCGVPPFPSFPPFYFHKPTWTSMNMSCALRTGPESQSSGGSLSSVTFSLLSFPCFSALSVLLREGRKCKNWVSNMLP